MPKIKDGSVAWAFAITLASCMALLAAVSFAAAIFARAGKGDLIGGLAFAVAAFVLFKLAARIRTGQGVGK